MDKQKKLILIDGHALAYRMFFALERTGMKTSTRQPTWAIYGFIKAIVDILKKIKPDAMVVSFDMGRKTFRTEEFEDYKAQRAPMPDDLRAQMQAIIDGVNAFDIPVFMKENFEADDIIGTIATKAKSIGHKAYILTGDQDSFQLIDKDGCIRVLIPHKNELIEYDSDKVFEKLGVYPEQIIDYKALRGDVSDNIPGVKGIGEKTAAKLLNDYKTLDNIYSNLDKITPNGVREKLTNGKDIAYKSQYLATIKRDVDVDFDFESASLNIPDVDVLREFLTKYEFHSLLRNLTEIVQLFNGKDLIIQKETLPSKAATPAENVSQLNLFESVQKTDEIEEEYPKNEFERIFIDTEDKLDNLVEELKKQTVIGMIFATDNFDMMSSKACGIGISFGNVFDISGGRLKLKNENAKIKTAYIPTSQAGKSYFDITTVFNKLKPVLENPNTGKITQNAKFVLHILKNHNAGIKNIIFDPMLADYIKDSSLKHGIKQQALSYLKYDMKDAQELIGKGKSAKSICSLEADIACDYFTDDAYALYELAKFHTKDFSEKEEHLFYDIELPLTHVLYKMERAGVSIDTNYLAKLHEEISQKAALIEQEIYAEAGEPFNINSPKQVGEILFEKMGLKSGGKNKTKTGYSTSAEILEELASEYKIARLILEYRHLTKIQSTYIDALPELIDKNDERIHTTFNQTITTTGRLSSSNPNLQNIPARTEIGNQIRGAFVPKNTEDYVILAADYSQIELRLLAHYSRDEVLIDAFNKNTDIHATTASKIFNVPINEVTKDMRRKAKAVNFGIIYGQTRYGLAEALSIKPAEAQEFIDKYFETYPNIKQYMEMTKMFALQNGYVETLYGRKRYFGNELNSSNRMIREFAIRAAINAPLQGTAADLIKLAMIKLDNILQDECKDAKIILQVHDELVIEVPKNCAQKAAELTIKAMELNQPLSVPLVVDLNIGKNWKESKNNEILLIKE